MCNASKIMDIQSTIDFWKSVASLESIRCDPTENHLVTLGIRCDTTRPKYPLIAYHL